MQEKNIFTITLSCSLIWHLLGVAAVSVVWPPQLNRTSYSQVTFWGVLLDNKDISPAKEDAAPVLKSADSGIGITSGTKQVDAALRIEKKDLPVSELSEKTTPEALFLPAVSRKQLVSEKIQDGLNRTVLHKPELPVYPEWAKEIGDDFEMELKFLILPDGTVGAVEKITSSGYPELDETGMRYIRKWRFIPISAEAPQEKQWGIIKLVFTRQ